MTRLTRVGLLTAGMLAISAAPAMAANLTVAPRKASFGCAQQEQFTTISAAVAAANPGDQITVCPGTYQEQVVINKANLSLQTPGNTPATIKAPTSLNSTGAVVEITAPGVKLQGFTITDSGQTTGNSGTLNYGVYIIDNGSGDLEHDDISNINDDPLNGDQHGVAVEAGDSSASPAQVGSVTLKNDTVENYQKNGVTVDGTGSIGDIENNVIMGAGPTPLIAQNGIQISDGATATIKTNTVSNNVYSQGTATATGILLFAAGRTDAEQNTVTTDDTGIYDAGPPTQGPAPTPPPGGPNPPGTKAFTTLNGNSITDGTFDGLVLDGDDTGVQAQNTQASGTWGHSTYGSDNGDGIDVFDTTGAKLMNNTPSGNSEDGLHVESNSTGNTLQGNQASANGTSTMTFDCEDDTGSTPTTIANTWTGDKGDVNLPQFICQGNPALATSPSPTSPSAAPALALPGTSGKAAAPPKPSPSS